MRREIRYSEYAALAELRYRIRQFLRGSDHAVEVAGLEPQQYQMLLAIRGLPGPNEANISNLAERLLIRHHSAVGLIDRLEARGYVRRDRGGNDQRQVSVILLPRGQRALEQVVGQRLHELRGSGHALVAAIVAILKESKSPVAPPRVGSVRAHNRKSPPKRTASQHKKPLVKLGTHRKWKSARG